MTRMMQQYQDAKAQHPGMLVLFRNGDFYELFEDDAILANRVLGLTLTKRDGAIPMAGVPVVKLEHYLGLFSAPGTASPSASRWRSRTPRRRSSSAR